FRQQVAYIKQYSPSLYQKYARTYQAVEQWLFSPVEVNNPYVEQYGLTTYQMAGQDGYGNVHFTGYYTPVVKARYTKDSEYRYPLYGMPARAKNKKGQLQRLPSRAQIYAGALNGKNLELAYTKSQLDNFIMGVQGSGYVDFQDGLPLTFFSYKGKNGHKYQSIGRLLVERGEISQDKISMQEIRKWYNKQSQQEQLALLCQNPSFVFFYPKVGEPVIGSAGVPLVAKTSVDSDRSLVPTGSVVIVELPLLNKKGKFTGKYESRAMIALDVGGAIKGQRLDLYLGIGDEAAKLAGYFNHY